MQKRLRWGGEHTPLAVLIRSRSFLHMLRVIKSNNAGRVTKEPSLHCRSLICHFVHRTLYIAQRVVLVLILALVRCPSTTAYPQVFWNSLPMQIASTSGFRMKPRDFSSFYRRQCISTSDTYHACVRSASDQ